MSAEPLGIGIDAVEIERFRKVLQRRPGLGRRLFTDSERAYGDRFADPAPRLAARFAAKEATMKALGVGIGSFGFHEVEVARRESGEPVLVVDGAAAALAAARGFCQWRLSLTHTGVIAQAVVVALGRGAG